MEIGLYKSINNGLGGEFDTTSNSLIFSNEGEIKYCCVYIKNETNKNKILQGVYNTCVDDIHMGIVKEDDNILINTLVDLTTNQVEYQSQISLYNFVLPSFSFITIWLKLDSSLSSHKSNKSVNIVVEYIDEH